MIGAPLIGRGFFDKSGTYSWFSWPNDTDGMAARLTIERSRRYPENVGTVSQARDRSN